MSEFCLVEASAASCQTPRAATEFVRAWSRSNKGKPPKSGTFTTPAGQITVWRESSKGKTAQWFVEGLNGNTLRGTRGMIAEELASQLCMGFQRKAEALAVKVA
jgi:hypothetical protein